MGCIIHDGEEGGRRHSCLLAQGREGGKGEETGERGLLYICQEVGRGRKEVGAAEEGGRRIRRTLEDLEEGACYGEREKV